MILPFVTNYCLLIKSYSFIRIPTILPSAFLAYPNNDILWKHPIRAIFPLTRHRLICSNFPTKLSKQGYGNWERNVLIPDDILLTKQYFEALMAGGR